MAKDITLLGQNYVNVPGVNLPQTNGGMAYFTDTSDATATASKILFGETAYGAEGRKLIGEAIGGTGAIARYYDDDLYEGYILHIDGVDISDSTIDANKILNGYVGYDSEGSKIIGTYYPTFVYGTFTTTSTSATVGTVSINYLGDGYPIAFMLYVDGGSYNSGNATWYNSLVRYAVAQWTMSKSNQTSVPTFTTSGGANQGVITCVFKNSDTSATTYGRTSAMNTNVFSSNNASGTGANCIKFSSKKSFKYYTADGTSTGYGLLPNLNYKYIVIYSN